MATLIDSSLIIAAERGDFDLDRFRTLRANELLAISVITAAELIHGVHRARDPGRRAQRRAFVEGALSVFRVIPFDLEIARLHGQLSADLASEGTTLGAHDLIISATALAHGYQVATRDLRSFPKVPGLKTISL